MASITTREYNPTTGTLMGNVSSLNFGKIATGSHSTVKVVDFAFTGVSLVSNIKIGIMDSTLDVNDGALDVQSDGTSSNGRYGIMHTNAFNKSLARSALGRHFAGINESMESTDQKNVLVGNKTATTSQFVYLDMELGANDFGVASVTFKIFFDYE